MLCLSVDTLTSLQLQKTKPDTVPVLKDSYYKTSIYDNMIMICGLLSASVTRHPLNIVYICQSSEPGNGGDDRGPLDHITG